MMPRRTPILLRDGPLTGEVMAITRYRRRTLENGREVIDASEKYSVHHDFLGVMLERLCADDHAIQPLLVKTARGKEPLSNSERARIGDFADRLGADITAFAALQETQGSE
jgi:hypothetical protein